MLTRTLTLFQVLVSYKTSADQNVVNSRNDHVKSFKIYLPVVIFCSLGVNVTFLLASVCIVDAAVPLFFFPLSRFCSNLGLRAEVQKAATHIARKAVDLDLVPGRSPISVAAAAIYMASQASDEKRSQKEIGDIAGVADVTIRQSYRLISLRVAELFPSDIKFVTPVDKLPNL